MSKPFQLYDSVRTPTRFVFASLIEARVYAHKHGFCDHQSYIYVEHYGCVSITPIIIPTEALQPGSNLWLLDQELSTICPEKDTVLYLADEGWEAFGFTTEFFHSLGPQEVSLDFLLSSETISEELRDLVLQIV